MNGQRWSWASILWPGFPLWMRVCVCCDEWAGARWRSLGGLGSICLSVSCQHCQWLTSSSTHSTSLFITPRVTHMRVHVHWSMQARTLVLHGPKTSFFITVDVHVGDSVKMEVRVRDGERQRGREMRRWMEAGATEEHTWISSCSLPSFSQSQPLFYDQSLFFTHLPPSICSQKTWSSPRSLLRSFNLFICFCSKLRKKKKKTVAMT